MSAGSRSEGVERRRDRGDADLGPLRLTAWWQAGGGSEGLGECGAGLSLPLLLAGAPLRSGCLSHTGSLSQQRQKCWGRRVFDITGSTETFQSTSRTCSHRFGKENP